MMRMSVATLLVLSTAMCVYARTHGEEVEYVVNDVVFKGYLAYNDEAKGKRPGVLVVHEWWGHNKYVRDRARMLAALGYTALAVDMYGDGKLAVHPDDARKFARAVTENMEIAKTRFTAGMDLLRKHPTVNSQQIAAIGYCFGGGIVLHMARLGIDGLGGVVSFHGSLSTDTPAARGTVKAKILVCHGGVDPFITQEQVDTFKEEMQNAGDPRREAAYHVDDDQVAVDIDAGAPRRFLAAADDIGVAAKFAARQDEGEYDHHQRRDQHRIRQQLRYKAELLWRQIGRQREPLKAAIGDIEEQAAIANGAQRLAQFGRKPAHHLLTIGEQEGDAAHNAEHAERGDEWGHLDPGHQHAVDQAWDQGDRQATQDPRQHGEFDIRAAIR